MILVLPQVRQVIAEFLPTVGLSTDENGRILEEIANENGLLKEQAQGWYGFLHLTLQEYFVAKYVVVHNELDTLLAHLGDPWWEEVLQLYAGQTPDASMLFQKLLGQENGNFLQEDVFQTNLIIAGRCLTAHPRIRQVAIREKIISDLFSLLQSTPYSITREQVIVVLVTIGGTEMYKHLLSLLLNKQLDTKVRSGIAWAFGEFEDSSLAPGLLPLLKDKQLDAEVRRGIAWALGDVGDSSLVPELLPLLKDEQLDVDVRRGIAQGLGKIGDSSLVPELLPLLKDKQLDANVRWGIAISLGDVGDNSLVPELLSLLKDKRLDPWVRRGVAQALGKIGDNSLVPELLPLLKDKQLDADVRSGIVQGLWEIEDSSLVPELLPLLKDEQLDAEARSGIASILGRLIRDETNVKALAAIMVESDIADSIHSALWTASKRARVRIYIINEPAGKRIELVKS